MSAHFLDGVNVGSQGLVACVSEELERSAMVDVPTVLLALASTALLIRYRVNSFWLVLAGALAGLGVSLAG